MRIYYFFLKIRVRSIGFIPEFERLKQKDHSTELRAIVDLRNAFCVDKTYQILLLTYVLGSGSLRLFQIFLFQNTANRTLRATKIW